MSSERYIMNGRMEAILSNTYESGLRNCTTDQGKKPLKIQKNEWPAELRT